MIVVQKAEARIGDGSERGRITFVVARTRISAFARSNVTPITMLACHGYPVQLVVYSFMSEDLLSISGGLDAKNEAVFRVSGVPHAIYGQGVWAQLQQWRTH